MSSDHDNNGSKAKKQRTTNKVGGYRPSRDDSEVDVSVDDVHRCLETAVADHPVNILQRPHSRQQLAFQQA
eukprot:scaffold1104_cov278-Alexandrium_tamarense.AAC.12